MKSHCHNFQWPQGFVYLLTWWHITINAITTLHDKYFPHSNQQVMTSCPQPDWFLFAHIHWRSFARTAGESKKWQFLQSETYFTVSTVKHHVTWHHLVILIEAWICLLKKRPSILDETKVPSLSRCGRMSPPPYVICKKTYCVCHRFQKLLCILCTICDWTRPKRGEHRFN